MTTLITAAKETTLGGASKNNRIRERVESEG